jgi:hypothetical protein
MENLLAKDLRLGNLIYVKCIAKEVMYDDFDVQECNIHNIKGILEGNEDFLYKPIRVTEEWLVKFGFEKRENFAEYTDIWQFKGFMVSLGDYINIHVDWADEEGYGYHSLACYEELFVHTLQNIHFALTLNELKPIENGK